MIIKELYIAEDDTQTITEREVPDDYFGDGATHEPEPTPTGDEAIYAALDAAYQEGVDSV